MGWVADWSGRDWESGADADREDARWWTLDLRLRDDVDEAVVRALGAVADGAGRGPGTDELPGLARTFLVEQPERLRLRGEQAVEQLGPLGDPAVRRVPGEPRTLHLAVALGADDLQSGGDLLLAWLLALVERPVDEDAAYLLGCAGVVHGPQADWVATPAGVASVGGEEGLVHTWASLDETAVVVAGDRA